MRQVMPELKLPYNTDVRRLVCILVVTGSTLGLHASVPSVNSPATLNRSANPQFESATQVRPALVITAAPADVSFYNEFYPLNVVRQERPKAGMFHWVGSLIKKGREKIALLSPQKFF
jgi:hypothetical protein